MKQGALIFDEQADRYGKSIRRKWHREGGRRMKMDFSKDERAMVYQYAAGTKEDTLAGLKEIVPVIRDRQTREIVESICICKPPRAAMTTPSMTKTPSARWMAASWTRRSCPCPPPR